MDVLEIKALEGESTVYVTLSDGFIICSGGSVDYEVVDVKFCPDCGDEILYQKTKDSLCLCCRAEADCE